MATFLAYIEPVMGRLCPLIPTLQELAVAATASP